MREHVRVRVYGEPAPQGSKNQWGGESSKKVKPWRERVAQVVGEAVAGLPLLRGPVQVKVEFAFPRPKSHFRTGSLSNVLRDDAPFWHTAPNDTDKLQRAIGDALTGVVWKDDKQICSWVADKFYDERAYADLTIIDLAGGPDVTDGTGSAEQGADPRPHHPR